MQYIYLLLGILAVNHIQAQQHGFRCMPYHGISSNCFSDVYIPPNYTYDLQSFSVCPSGYYCPVQISSSSYPYVPMKQNASCVQKKQTGSLCNFAFECFTGNCIQGTCATRSRNQNESCSYFYECAAGSKCLISPTGNGTCINATVNPGGVCTDDAYCTGNNICDNGTCVVPLSRAVGQTATKRYSCQSFTLTGNVCDYPAILQGAGSNGLKPCQNATDCIYIKGTTLKKASDLGKTCVQVSYSDSNQSYCELGEGDAFMQASLAKVL